MTQMIEQLKEQLAVFGPNLLAGLAVLVVGWLVALLASFLVRKGLGKTSVDNKIAQWMSGSDSPQAMPVEQWVGRAVFYLVMLLVVIAFLSTIKLDVISEPLKSLVQPFIDYLPNLVAGGVLGLVAWVVATVIKKLLATGLRAAKLDEKLGGPVKEGDKPAAMSNTFAEAVYWLIFLIFLPLILNALKLQALLEPVTQLLNKLFAFLPNLLSALAIGVVGWFVALILRRVVQSLLASAGVDSLSEKWGLAGSFGKQKLSGVIGLLLFIVILVPVLISALGALELQAVTQPASDMLAKFLAAMPNIVGAALIILLAVIVGKIVASIVTSLLAGLGFNNVLVKLGLAKTPAQGKSAPAAIVGTIALVFIILMAAVSAANMLQFQSVSALVQDFIGMAGHVALGIIIFGLGLLLAQLVAKVVLTSDSRNARRLALAARVVILALTGAMALRQTGLANEIVNLAFGMVLGAVAVAFALAFGLGGRDLASRTLQEWRDANTDKK